MAELYNCPGCGHLLSESQSMSDCINCAAESSRATSPDPFPMPPGIHDDDRPRYTIVIIIYRQPSRRLRQLAAQMHGH